MKTYSFLNDIYVVIQNSTHDGFVHLMRNNNPNVIIKLKQHLINEFFTEVLTQQIDKLIKE